MPRPCADVCGPTSKRPNDPRFSNMVERVRNRALTDKTVGDIFASLTRDELLKRLSDADIAFAEVNTMADLAVHPHLRRIEVDTPGGPVSYPAPAAIVVDAPRHYGAVPGIGERIGIAKPPLCGSEIVMTEGGGSPISINTPVAMDRPHHRGLRRRHRATGEGPARHAVHGDRRTEAGRSRAVDRALVPGAAGLPDVDAEPGRPSHARRLSAAGAAAAPDVGRRRAGILRAAARPRRDDANLADIRCCMAEDRQHRGVCVSFPSNI